jgi:hypothetical protein
VIVIHINPAGVENVYFHSTSDLAEDLCMAIWPLVRQDLGRLHKKLRRATKSTLELVQDNPSSDEQPPEAKGAA